jgi:plasmid stability protein
MHLIGRNQKLTAMQSLLTMQAHSAGDIIPMSSITIRNLDPAVKERLRVRAAQQGHSMEAEARDIISSAVGADRPREVNLAEAIRRRFAPLGGADDLEIPPREPVRDPPRFE